VVLTKQIQLLVIAMAAAGSLDLVRGHDVITTKLTWSKEVSRVVFARCAGCHRPEGKAFSLLKYEEARPWAKAIQEEVLRRRMPPTNAVKGFGELRHDLGLSQEEIHLLADWVEGGAPEGDVNLLPPTPKPAEVAAPSLVGRRIPMRGNLKLTAAARVLGVEMGEMAPGTSFKLVAEKTDGTRVPLIWIEGFSLAASRVYEFREAVQLEAGARVVAYPRDGVELRLITGSSQRR